MEYLKMVLCKELGKKEIIQRVEAYGLTGFYIDQTRYNYRILKSRWSLDGYWSAMPIATFPNKQKAILKLKKL
tara:strand:+ start:626 stop:844 length:219 start_codon:yes stop_codon:yes gene_type:complete